MTPRDLMAAFETLADAPGGIKRLRELVLQLAVRGKLVPQVAGDEPAGMRKVSDVATLLNGYAFKSEWYVEDGVRVIRNQNVGHGTARWEDTKRVGPSIATEFARFALQVGDIVLSLDRPIISTGLKVAVIGKADLPCLLLQRVAKLEIRLDRVSPSYFYLWLNSPAFMGAIDPGRSNGVPHISTKEIERLTLHVPPLAEQHRIVAKVDELMAFLDKLDAAKNARDATRTALRDAALAALRDADGPDEVEAAWGRIAGQMDDLFAEPGDVGPLRQAVLQLAVRGRLVRRPVSSQAIPQVKLLELLREPLSNGKSVPDGIGGPVLKLGALRTKVVDITQVKLGNWDGLDFESFQIRKGDLLVVRGNGSRDLVAKASVVAADAAVAFPDTAIRVRTKSDSVDPDFLHYAWHSRAIRDQLEARAKTTAGIWKVNQTDVESVLVPLPPVAEQHRIVAKVDELMALLDKLEARLRAGQELQGAFAAAAVHHLDVEVVG